MKDKELTRTLARFVVDSRLTDIPPRVRHEGKRSFLNWFGCAVGGSHHETVDIAAAVRAGFSGPAQATLIGRGQVTDAPSAAFINGVAAHVLDFDDGQPRNTNLNPTAAVAPAPLALGEHLKSSGADVLHAFILGLEVECRIANAVYLTDNTRWFTNSTTGVFGAAAAGSKLLGLDVQRMTWALGIAATQSSGLREMFGTMCKSFSCGRAAENGILAARLAQKGFTSSNRAIEAPRGFAQVFLPGSDPGPIVEGLGESYEVSYNTYKPFACGIVLHAAIDACIQARKKHHPDRGAIAKIVVRVNPIVVQITGKLEPRTGLESKFSVFHSAAVALIDGAAGERQYTDARAADPQVIALRGRVEAIGDARLRRDQAHVRIVMDDGREYEHAVEHAIGTLDNPLTDADLEAKFRSLSVAVLGGHATQSAIEMCWGLDELEDFSRLPAAARGEERQHARR
jgi:2-methylcitrate dehydratase PrpD